MNLVCNKPQANDVVRYLNPLDILPGLVRDAFDKRDPVGEIVKLQMDPRYNYPAAHLVVFDRVCEVESAAFDRFVQDGYSNAELRALVQNGYSLLERFVDLSDSTAQSAAPSTVDDQTVSSREGVAPYQNAHAFGVCRGWARLMLAELKYVSQLPEWAPEHVAIANHAIYVLSGVSWVWDRPDLIDVFGALDIGVGRVLEDILQSRPFRKLIATDSSIDEVQLVGQALHLAELQRDDVLAEILISFLPEVHQICSQLDPEEFNIEGDPDGDDYGWEEFDQKSEQYPSESAADTEFSYSYEVDSDFESAAFDTTRQHEHDAIANQWEEIFDLLLLSFEYLKAPGLYSDELLTILESSPPDMELWGKVADALMLASPQAIKDFVPQLVQRCAENELWNSALIHLASYSYRVEDMAPNDPLRWVVDALREVPIRQRKEILTGCKSMLKEAPELVHEPDTGRVALRRIFKMLAKKRKS
ncbi:MAG: hypothetical protein ACK5Y6_05865 [Pseudomonadota bacterium]